MDIDDTETPNPNTTDTLPPPQTTVPLPIPPPIAPIPRPPPRPQNDDEEKSENDDSSPEYEISEESKQFREKKEKAKQEFLMKQRAAALSVPTNDKSVRSRLRRLSEPITLFGEKEMERRERLRMIMAKLDSEGQLETLMRVFEEEGMEDGGGGEEDEGEAVQYPFYTEGSMELLKVRYEIAKSSVLRAAERLGRARRKRDDPDEDFDGEVNWALENAKSFVLDCSEIGDDRPLSGCSFSCDSMFLATCQKASDEEEPENDDLSLEYEISEDSKQFREKKEKAKKKFRMKQRAAALCVLINDKLVRSRLRRLSEPITLFGEKEMERRERLRMIMAKLDSEGQLETLMRVFEEEGMEDGGGGEKEEGEAVQYPFYTEGSEELLKARYEIAKSSVLRAAERLGRAKRKRDDPDEDFDGEVNWALKNAKSFVLDCSEIEDDRQLSGCSFSCDNMFLATCSLTGVAKVWSMPGVKIVSSLKGHTERATDVTFSPTNNHIATASADRTARLWNTEGSLLNTYKGHLDRLARVAFHPSGKYLGTTSFDKTWRLWDTETGEELLLQEGHSRSVYGLAFHTDGSLAASCGLDALARVWDLRSGRSILALEGHVKPVLGISFSPNGYHLATGGEDNTCRIWDLRKKRSLYTIPAHANLISQIKFEPQEGYFLVTASYDMTAKVWSSRDFKPVKVLSGHEAKVTSVDVAGDGTSIATVSHDRTIKLWSSKIAEKEKAMDVD